MERGELQIQLLDVADILIRHKKPRRYATADRARQKFQLTKMKFTYL